MNAQDTQGLYKRESISMEIQQARRTVHNRGPKVSQGSLMRCEMPHTSTMPCTNRGSTGTIMQRRDQLHTQQLPHTMPTTTTTGSKNKFWLCNHNTRGQCRGDAPDVTRETLRNPLIHGRSNSYERGHNNTTHHSTTTVRPLQSHTLYRGSMSIGLLFSHCLGAASEGGFRDIQGN